MLAVFFQVWYRTKSFLFVWFSLLYMSASSLGYIGLLEIFFAFSTTSKGFLSFFFFFCMKDFMEKFNFLSEVVCVSLVILTRPNFYSRPDWPKRNLQALRQDKLEPQKWLRAFVLFFLFLTWLKPKNDGSNPSSTSSWWVQIIFSENL